MHPLNWSFVSIIVALLITTESSNPSNYEQQQQGQRIPVIPAYQSSNIPPYWENILREFVFKTISPPPPGNNALYKSLLQAPFYGGPFPIITNDEASVVLSRGDVYYLPNSRWLLCQEGCVDCEACTEQNEPTVKWILRRIKRPTFQSTSRYDLQLTIIPQMDGSYHMKHLWPRSYVYVTSPEEETAYLIEKSGYRNAGSAFTSLEDSFPGQRGRSGNFWRAVETDSMIDRPVTEQKSDPIGIHDGSDNNTRDHRPVIREPEKDDTPRYKHRIWDFPKEEHGIKTMQRPMADDSLRIDNSSERSLELKQLLPKLILGTDQLGQKHLIHVVPAEHAATPANSSALVMSVGGQEQNRTNYQRILRKIFNSLKSQRHSIENFLEPSMNKQNRNPELMRPGLTRQRFEEHQEEETRNGPTALKQVTRLDRDYDEISESRPLIRRRWPLPFKWRRYRRKTNGVIDADGIAKGGNNTNRNITDNHYWKSEIETGIHNFTFNRQLKNVSDQLRLKLLRPDYYENKFNSNEFNGDINNRELEPVNRTSGIITTTDSTLKLPDVISNEAANQTTDIKNIEISDNSKIHSRAK